MKKLSLLLTLLVCLCIASTAGAEKIKFKDKNFNYKGYKEVEITALEDLNYDKTDFVTDSATEMKIKTLLMSAFNKKSINVTDVAAGSTKPAPSLTPIPEISVKVYVLGYDKIWHDAWVETQHYTETYTIQEKDNRGRYHDTVVRVPATRQIEHPAGYYHTARVDMEFTVRDPRTQKVIYSIRDTRSRGGEDDTSGMLKRICGDFVDDITKN